MRALLPSTPRWLLPAAVGSAAAAANVSIGLSAAVGQDAMRLALLAGILPALIVGFGALVQSHRATLAWIALSINLSGVAFLQEPLPLPGGTRVFPTDVLLLLAVGAWLASRLLRVSPRHPVTLSRTFGWPLGFLAVTVMLGVILGHERYGASIVGQPLRLVLYAGIALALTDLTVDAAWRAITMVFYAGTVIQFLWAAYYLATGTSGTQSDALTTGGVRVVALSTAIYLTGSLVCALLNLELDRGPTRQLLHLAIAGLALFSIVVSFGRTTYAAVALIVPLLLVSRRYLRRTLLWVLPLFLPVLLIVAIIIPVAKPDMVPTLQARLTGTSTNDGAVVWRERALHAALSGVEDEWLMGVGFGRRTQFTLDGQIVRIEGDPHNSYAWLLAGGGVLALGALLVLCGTHLLDTVRRLRRVDARGQALVVWALATWLAFMMNALTGPVLVDPVMVMTVWILTALPSVAVLTPAR